MLHDLTLAWKRLRNSPGFALVAVVTLTMAVGANTAIFMVADAVLFRPLPYEDPERLFVVRQADQSTGVNSTGVPYDYVAAIQRAHSGVAGVALRSTTIQMEHPGAKGGELVEFVEVAPDYFQILGIRTARGRLFESADITAQGSRILLSYESWRTRFGRDESIVGRQVTFGSRSREVVGVLPDGFIFPSASSVRTDGITGKPEFAVAATPPDPHDLFKRSTLTRAGVAMDPVVRLRNGVTQQEAQAELDVLAAGITVTGRQRLRGRVILEDVRSVLFPTGRRILVLLFVSAGLVLLIGCANLANLLIARTEHRERDFAVQSALGATPLHLTRQIVFEGVIIGGIAGALAVFATFLLANILLREIPPIAYGRAFVQVDLRVALFGFVIALLSSVLFAVWPAFRATRADVLTLIRSTANRRRPQRRRIGQPMLVLQVALALTLVVGGVTAAREFRGVANQPLGFDPTNLIAVEVGRGLEEHVLRDFFERVAKSVEQFGDVIAAGAASSRPFDRSAGAEGLPDRRPDIPVAHVLPGYLEALGVRVVGGRLSQSSDSPIGLEPVVLTRSAAAKLFPGRSAIGAMLPLGGRSAEVVGVIDDVRTDFEAEPSWIYLVPRSARYLSSLVVRTRARRADVLEEVRRRIVTLAPPSKAVTVRWLDDSMAGHAAYRNPRFQTVVLGSFSALAVGLAALGIFAIVAATVAQRTREMGIRIAIGAPRAALIRVVLRDAIVPVVAGVALGVGLTQAARRLAQSYVPGLTDPDPWAVVVAGVVVTCAGLVAAYLPACRATRVDPIVVLRAE
jgi:putative ABC transport system permease protein